MRTLLFVVALAALTPPLHAYAGSDKAENCKEAADKKDLEGDDRRKFLRKCSSVGSQRVEILQGRRQEQEAQRRRAQGFS